MNEPLPDGLAKAIKEFHSWFKTGSEDECIIWGWNAAIDAVLAQDLTMAISHVGRIRALLVDK